MEAKVSVLKFFQFILKHKDFLSFYLKNLLQDINEIFNILFINTVMRLLKLIQDWHRLVCKGLFLRRI